jgi:hypothetical protein
MAVVWIEVAQNPQFVLGRRVHNRHLCGQRQLETGGRAHPDNADDNRRLRRHLRLR